MKELKTILKLGIIIFLLFSFSACSQSDMQEKFESGKNTIKNIVGISDSPEVNLKKVSLRLQWLPMCQFAGYYAAKEKGFYKAEGLDVEILPGGPDFQSIPLVANGTNDFGVWTADAVLIAKSKGIPVTGISVFFRKSPLGYMVMADSNIKGPQDFPGKKIGMIYGRDVEFAYVAMLNNAGVDRKLLTEIPEKFNMALFYQGEYDVYSVYVYDQPYTARKDGYDVRIISPADYNVEYYADTLITSDNLIGNDPETVKAFVKASVKGWEWALKNPAETVNIVLGVDKSLTKDSQDFQMKTIKPLIEYEDPEHLGRINIHTVEKMKKELFRQGILKNDVDVNNAFTNRFLSSAH